MKITKPQLIVIITIAIVISVGSIFVAVDQQRIYNQFEENEVVIFNTPALNQSISLSTLLIDIDVYPDRIDFFYIKTWHLYLKSEAQELLICFNNDYHSPSALKIQESVFLPREGSYSLILILDCYCNKRHYLINSTNQFMYQR